MSAEDPVLEAVKIWPECCDRSGALRLKAKIEAYWAARGHKVNIMLKDSGFHPAIRSSRYDIRSDLVDGLPSPASISKQVAA